MGRGRRHKWLGWWLLFSLSPLSGSFQGLRWCCGLFLFFLVAGLSFSEKIQTSKRTPEWRLPARAESFIPGHRPTLPNMLVKRPCRETLCARSELIGQPHWRFLVGQGRFLVGQGGIGKVAQLPLPKSGDRGHHGVNNSSGSFKASVRTQVCSDLWNVDLQLL